jgi:hypothetical protein
MGKDSGHKYDYESFIYGKLNPDKRIRNAFNRQFPKASDVEWSFKDNFYLAEFVQTGIYKIACFDTDGEFQYVRILLTEDKIPVNILKKIQQKFKIVTLVSITEIKYRETSNYEIIVDTSNKTRNRISIDKQGKILSNESLFAIKPGLLGSSVE